MSEYYLGECEFKDCDKSFGKAVTRKLFRVIEVSLCMEHLREWEVAAVTEPKWLEFLQNDLKVIARVTVGNEDIDDLAAKSLEILEELRVIVMDWIESIS